MRNWNRVVPVLGFGSGTTFDPVLWTQALVEDVDLVLDILVQALREPLFPAAQIETRAWDRSKPGLEIRADDTRRMANLAFYGRHYTKITLTAVRFHGYLPSIDSISPGRSSKVS